jgi:hypothetical protein
MALVMTYFRFLCGRIPNIFLANSCKMQVVLLAAAGIAVGIVGFYFALPTARSFPGPFHLRRNILSLSGAVYLIALLQQIVVLSRWGSVLKEEGKLAGEFWQESGKRP